MVAVSYRTSPPAMKQLGYHQQSGRRERPRGGLSFFFNIALAFM
jgi:hypothetical protein